MSPDAHFTQDMLASRDAGGGASKYRKLDILGRGAYGEVYRAQDIHTNRMVALKLLWGGCDVLSFLREVECHARLHHSNIAQIYDAGEWSDGRFYIALQLIDGSDLSSKLGDETLRDPQAIAQLISRVARAIHFAHEQNVLHCDLKPSNILIDRRGVPFVSDFSIARQLDREWSGNIEATLPYMAPEQCEEAVLHPAMINRWTDVFALGVILYELATGELPYAPDPTLAERRARFARGEQPEPPSVRAARDHYALGRKLDPDFDRLCAWALARNANDRYPSADALADDLDRWVLGLPICGPKRKAPPASAYLRSFVRRNARVLCVCVLPVIGFLALSLYTTRLAVAHLEERFWSANRTAAQLSGQILAARFEGYRRELADLAQDPSVKRVFLQGPADVAASDSAGQKMSAMSWRDGPDQFYFIDPRGCFVSYWPAPAVSLDVYESWYGFRSYFTCAEALHVSHSRSACISRVFRSEYDWVPNTLRIAVAAPVYADDDTWLGVLAASWPIERSLSELNLASPAVMRSTTSLLVARDRDRGQLKAAGTALPSCGGRRGPFVPDNPHVGPAPREELLIVPRRAPRDERFLSRTLTQRIGAHLAQNDLSDADFVDPRDAQRYAVAFATLNQHPVGDLAVDQAPLLVMAMDRSLLTDYTGTIYVLLLVLWLGSGVLLYGLLVTLARRDTEQLRWLKGS